MSWKYRDWRAFFGVQAEALGMNSARCSVVDILSRDAVI